MPTRPTCAASKPRPPVERPGAFTLIKLLVVIAIISLLASLIFPALATAKRKGKAAACLNNLHQIGLGLMLYIDDNANHLPVCAGLLPSQNTTLPPIWATLQPFVPSKAIFRCPEDLTVFFQEGTSYEWNMYFNGAPYTATPEDGTDQATLVTIYQGKINTPLMGDANAFHVIHPPAIGRNALYFDGRVQNYVVPIPSTLLNP